MNARKIGDFRPRQVRAWQDNPEQCYTKSEIRQAFVETGILALPATLQVVVVCSGTSSSFRRMKLPGN